MKQHAMSHGSGGNPYLRLAAMSALSFAAMFILMYAMVDRFANVLSNLNQVYMAGLMTAPMVIIELLIMRSMYPNPRINLAVLVGSAALLGGSWMAIRTQGGITDRQFLRSMIPHHGAAILMCQQTTLKDPALERLCAGIVSSQQGEIDFMKGKLREHGK